MTINADLFTTLDSPAVDSEIERHSRMSSKVFHNVLAQHVEQSIIETEKHRNYDPYPAEAPSNDSSSLPHAKKGRVEIDFRRLMNLQSPSRKRVSEICTSVSRKFLEN